VSSDDTGELDGHLDGSIDEVEAALRETRARLAEVPVADVIVNHVMGFYELAAIHLSSTPPRLTDAATAIDAMSAVVHTLEGRLGENEPVMLDALQNIQFAFVQIKATNT
jgi:hypothetical protein